MQKIIYQQEQSESFFKRRILWKIRVLLHLKLEILNQCVFCNDWQIRNFSDSDHQNGAKLYIVQQVWKDLGMTKRQEMIKWTCYQTILNDIIYMETGKLFRRWSWSLLDWKLRHEETTTMAYYKMEGDLANYCDTVHNIGLNRNHWRTTGRHLLNSGHTRVENEYKVNFIHGDAFIWRYEKIIPGCLYLYTLQLIVLF